MILSFIIRVKGENCIGVSVYTHYKTPTTLHTVSILGFNLGDREGHVDFCEQKDIKDIIMWVVPNYFSSKQLIPPKSFPNDIAYYLY